MSLVNDAFLPTGTYAIINAKYDHSITFNKQDESLSTSNAVGDCGWTISSLKDKKWTIQGPSETFADLAQDVEEGADVILVKNPAQPHQWVIRQHIEGDQFYRIYSPSQPQLFWSLLSANLGNTPQLSTYNGSSSLWKFKKMDRPFTGLEMSVTEVATIIPRPAQLDSATKHRISIAIPPGWLTTITSVSCGSCINLVRIRRTVDGAWETQDFLSRWDAIDKAMTLDGSESDALALPVAKDPYVLVAEVFHSKNSAIKDPRALPRYNSMTTELRVITSSCANDMRSFRDFQTFMILGESPEASGSGRTQNVIITITSAQVAATVDVTQPGKSDSEIRGVYNKELPNRPRPSYMDEWLEKYRVVFIVDDSRAMTVEGAWGKAAGALIQIASEVMQYDTNGIDLYFLNSMLHREGIVTRNEVVEIFNEIKPQGSSPIDARLGSAFDTVIAHLEQAKSKLSDSKQIKPINIIVFTNSSPSDDTTKAIRLASRKLNAGLYHPDGVGIQFVQIGDDNQVEKSFKNLCNDPSFNFVSFDTKSTPDNPRVRSTVLSTRHSSARGRVAGPSGPGFLYYRVCDADGAIATKRPAYRNDEYIGRIASGWVAPPYNAGSLKQCLSTMENIDPSDTILFAMPSSQCALADDTPAPLDGSQTLGLRPEEPVALFCTVRPQDGVKPETTTFSTTPDAESPLPQRFVYYVVYTKDGAMVPKNPLNAGGWVSRVNLDLIPSPPSIASLRWSITLNEGLTFTSSQLFADKDALAPLHDDYGFFAEGGNWPGSTADDHVMFKVNRLQVMETIDESRFYRVQNFSTGKIMHVDVIKPILRLSSKENAPAGYHHFVFEMRRSGAIAFRSVQWLQWAEADFGESKIGYSFYFVHSEINEDCFFICSDPSLRLAVHDGDLPTTSGECYALAWEKFNVNDRRQMWRLLPVQKPRTKRVLDWLAAPKQPRTLKKKESQGRVLQRL